MTLKYNGIEVPLAKQSMTANDHIKYMSVGQNDVLDSSFNGSSWTDQSGNVTYNGTDRLDATLHFRDAAYANGKWVAVGGYNDGDSNPHIFSSDNGVSWRSTSSDLYSGASEFTVVAYGNGQWLASGEFGIASSRDAIEGSTHGEDWALVSLPTSVNKVDEVDEIIYDAHSGRWFVFGEDKDANAFIFSSANNGSSWKTQTAPSGVKITSAATDGAGNWVLGVDDTTNAVYSGTWTGDGTFDFTWNAVSTLSGLSTGRSIAYHDSLWVLAAQTGDGDVVTYTSASNAFRWCFKQRKTLCKRA